MLKMSALSLRNKSSVGRSQDCSAFWKSQLVPLGEEDDRLVSGRCVCPRATFRAEICGAENTGAFWPHAR